MGTDAGETLSLPPLSLLPLAQPVPGTTKTHAASLELVGRRLVQTITDSVLLASTSWGGNLRGSLTRREVLPVWAFSLEISRAPAAAFPPRPGAEQWGDGVTGTPLLFLSRMTL